MSKKMKAVKEKEENNKLLFINQSYFVYSVMTLVKLLKEVAETLVQENKIPENKVEVHKKFRQTCDDIIAVKPTISSGGSGA